MGLIFLNTLGRFSQDQMAAQTGIVIVGTDPDKCFTQGHHGAVDPGNKEIIDVAINDLPACYPSAAVFFLVGQALAFKELHVGNRYSKSLCEVDMNA